MGKTATDRHCTIYLLVTAGGKIMTLQGVSWGVTVAFHSHLSSCEGAVSHELCCKTKVANNLELSFGINCGKKARLIFSIG
jgi:hypothetical protein